MSDTFACTLAALHALSAVKRVSPLHGGEEAVIAIAAAPQRAAFYAVLAAFLVGALLPLGLMLLRPGTYRRYGRRLMLANRLLRLGANAAMLSRGWVRHIMAAALAVRVRGLSLYPRRSVAVLALQPASFWQQQSYFLIPWRWAVAAQAVNFVASLPWSAQLPCLLDAHLGQRVAAPLMQEAQELCQAGQYAAALVSAMAGDVVSPLLGPDVCASTAALQQLQVRTRVHACMSACLVLLCVRAQLVCARTCMPASLVQWAVPRHGVNARAPCR